MYDAGKQGRTKKFQIIRSYEIKKQECNYILGITVRWFSDVYHTV